MARHNDDVEHDSFLNDPPTELLDQLAAIALCDDDSGTSDDEVVWRWICVIGPPQ